MSIHNENCKNHQRAIHADIALETYSLKTGCVDEPDETWVIDLLSDLMHMCDRDKLNFEDLLRIARGHYQSEAEHDDEDCKTEEE
jgi:hypothetical protein